MALKKKPVNGMKDILPSEMAVRMYVTELIRRTYAEFGFSSIIRAIASSSEKRLLYGRSEVRAAYTSHTRIILAPIGMLSPDNPSG